MFLAFERLPEGRRFDVCVVGTGPAGLTVARAIGRRGKSVLLLEGGGREATAESQDVLKGTVRGHPYFDLEYARLRFLGGSSNHWGGYCRPLDAIDFEPKEWAPDAQWPIRKADLDPYAAEAAEILEVPAQFNEKVVGNGVKRVDLHQAWPPPKLGQKFEGELSASKTIFCVLNANLTGISTDGSRVNQIEVRNYSGLAKRVTADRFVLALGGIENSRMLLHLNRLTEGRLIKRPETLGRYWMEHPNFTIGEALIYADSGSRRTFSLTADMQRRLRVMNCGLLVHPVPGRGYRRLVRELACVAPTLGQWVYRQVDRNLVCALQLRAQWEQAPVRQNRIELDPKRRDRFGIPLTVLSWTISQQDIDTVRRTAAQYATHVARSGEGRVRIFDWVLERGETPPHDQIGSHHHMGGTRMSASPETGIVDQNCRVWGQDNLYIAGSSVFSSGGWTNPTFPIVQLALRLSDHLARLK